MIRSLIALLALVALVRADEWQTITGCRLMENESNDGTRSTLKRTARSASFASTLPTLPKPSRAATLPSE